MSYAQATGSDGVAPERPRRMWTLLPFLGVAVGLAVLGLLTTTPLASAWFTDGPRVEWTPQIWLFTAAWAVIYAVDAVAGWLLWSRRVASDGADIALALYWVQIGLQAAWLLGFMAQAFVAGAWLWGVFAVIVLLDVVTAITALSAWRISRPAAVLLVLVLAWLLFGTALSGAETILRADLT